MRLAQSIREHQRGQVDPDAPEPSSSLRGWIIFLGLMVAILIGASLVAHFFAWAALRHPPRR